MTERLLTGFDAEDYDWGCAFAYAQKPMRVEGATVGVGPCRLADVNHVECALVGENDGPPWICIVQMVDGRWMFLEAGCDYTGWDCQASGDVWVADSLEQLWRFGVTQDARERFEREGYKAP